VGQTKLLDGLRSLRDYIFCEVEPFKLPRGFFGEFEPTHGCLRTQLRLIK
jgi:hypothetical protein